jgi:PAS domain S-box-containing protein
MSDGHVHPAASEPMEHSSWRGARVAMNLRRQKNGMLKRYGLALALSGVALLIRSVLPVPLGTTIYQLPLAAVVLSGWFGGRGPGLLATLICATGALYGFIPPLYSFDISPEYRLAFAIFVGLCVLLTEFGEARWRASDVLEESESRFRLMAETVPEMLWFQSVEPPEMLYASPRYQEIWGHEVGELKGVANAWLKAVHPEDSNRARSAYEAWLSGEGTGRLDVTFRIVRADGETRWIQSRATLIRDERGKPYRGSGITEDVTDEVHAQEALANTQVELRVRQEMLDLAQKAARAVAFDWHIGARESENRWSPDLEAMYGLESGTFDRTFQGWKKLIHPDDWPTVKLAIQNANASGDVAAQYRVIHKDGTVHWLQAKGRMFFDPRPVRMVGFMIDVTDRRQAEEELRASEARFRTLVDHASDAFYLSDDQSRIIDVNEAACQMLGYSRDVLVGMHPSEFDAGLDEASIEQLAQRVLAGETVTFETLHRRRDGTIFPVEIRGRGFEKQGQHLLLALVRDITERKHVEETLREKDQALQMARTELARVSRLTTLGELTTSIAHEVAQPLGGMIASAGACTRWLAAEPPRIAEARAALENISADGKRAREVIARIRALTKRQMPRNESLDINAEVLEVLALTERELRGHDIVLRTQLDRTLPRVAGDRVQLQQVLINLIMNAIEAMSGVRDRPRELTIVSGRDDATAAMVEVRDSGIGLDPNVAERVFDAFYTTKTEGIGIGLSISRSIIEAHGGRLWASANEPYGAIFRFSLPFAAEALS